MSSLPDVYSSELGQLGLDEVEPWVVEDSYENRRILRSNGFLWDQLTDDEGVPAGLIRAFSREALKERRDSVWERRKPILQDPTDPWSDYISPLEYPPDVDAPFWVRGRVRGWYEQEAAGTPEDKRKQLPVRCTVVRTDGTRCWNWTSSTSVKRNPDKRCKQHMGWAVDKDLRKVQAARVRVAQSSLRAAEILEELADTASGEAVRLKAATEILDRAGVRGGTEIDISGQVEHTDTASEEVRSRLRRLSERLEQEARAREQLNASEDVVDAEVVSDDDSSSSSSSNSTDG